MTNDGSPTDLLQGGGVGEQPPGLHLWILQHPYAVTTTTIIVMATASRNAWWRCVLPE